MLIPVHWCAFFAVWRLGVASPLQLGLDKHVLTMQHSCASRHRLLPLSCQAAASAAACCTCTLWQARLVTSRGHARQLMLPSSERNYKRDPSPCFLSAPPSSCPPVWPLPPSSVLAIAALHRQSSSPSLPSRVQVLSDSRVAGLLPEPPDLHLARWSTTALLARR
jgi:hypothetical protein